MGREMDREDAGVARGRGGNGGGTVESLRAAATVCRRKWLKLVTRTGVWRLIVWWEENRPDDRADLSPNLNQCRP